MKRKEWIAIIGVVIASLCFEHALRADGGFQIDATLSKKISADENPIEPTNQFPKETPEIFATWKSTQAKEGQTAKAVWIAEDVGQAAPRNTKIIEKSMQLNRQAEAEGKNVIWWNGHFSLSKPTNGWPVGKYRVEIYFDEKLVKTLPFVIQ